MDTKLIIFGLTGDLGKRKLLPAMQKLFATREHDAVEVIGVSRRDVDIEALLQESIADTTYKDHFSMLKLDLASPDEYYRLRDQITDAKHVIFYLSVPPDSSAQIIENLGKVGLNDNRVRLMLEKPFGVDLASAKQSIDTTRRYFTDKQVYRIDHYLAKEMVQNIVLLRANNPLLAAGWNSTVIESIDVIASEKIDIQGRATFYEQTGALRDLIQGHLLQILALLLLRTDDGFTWEDVSSRRLEALRNIRIVPAAQSVRLQYQGYRDEAGNPDSQTETLAGLTLVSDDPRWSTVTMRLISGKALAEKATYTSIIVRGGSNGHKNKLIIHIDPDQRIELDVALKKSGYDHELTRQTLRTGNLSETVKNSYEQVLVDGINGVKSLFVTPEELIRAWEIVDEVQTAWANHTTPLGLYAKGSAIEAVIAEQ